MKNGGIRYSNKGIVMFIVILSVLTIFFSEISTHIIRNGDNMHSDIIYEMSDIVEMSMYKGSNYYSKNTDYLNYAIRTQKIDNYNETEEYLEEDRKRNNVFITDENGFTIAIIPKDDYERNKEMYDHEYRGYSINVPLKDDQSIELKEPEYKITYLTNIEDMSYKKKDPQEISFIEEYKNTKSAILIKGFYENGRINFTDLETKSADNEKAEFQVKETASNLKKAIERAYENIDENFYNINKMNFAYGIDLNSTGYQNFIENMEFKFITSFSMMIGFLISIAFMFIYSIISNYEKLRDVEFAKGIKKFPIEVVMMLVFAWMGSLAIIFEEMDNMLIFDLWQLYLFESVFSFFAFVAVYYVVIAVKSIYKDGKKSFVWQNSVICRILKVIVGFIINSNDISNRASTKLIVSIIIIGILGSLGAEFSNADEWIIIVWIAFLAIVYLALRKIAIDMEDVNNNIKKISKGDFESEIDEKNTAFKDIAHNLNSIADNLSISIDEAVKSEKMKTDLITNVSHDLKTPLTAIINYSDLLLNVNNTDEEIKEYSEIIHEKSIKLKNLVEDLFEVSKASSGNILLDINDIDLKMMTMQIIGEWEDEFSEKNLEIIVKVPDEDIILRLDANKTSRVLDNVFSNIYKYSLEGSRVYVDIIKCEEKIRLEVKNISGYALNISADELIERFTRGDEARNTEGSGIGLSIIKSFVEAQNGRFDIKIDGDLFKVIIEF